MRIQIFNAYLRLMSEGKVPVLNCGDPLDLPPLARVTDHGPEFYCMSCPWTFKPNHREYQSIVNMLYLHDYRWEDYAYED